VFHYERRDFDGVGSVCGWLKLPLTSKNTRLTFWYLTYSNGSVKLVTRLPMNTTIIRKGATIVHHNHQKK